MRYFKGKQFKQDIILVAVGYYCRFSLSYRDVSEILKERGVSVHPTTIMCWVHEYGHLIYQIWKKKNKTAHQTRHLDETYIKVKGEWCYLYCAIDGEGHTLDIQLCRTRDHQAAYAFMKRLDKHFGEPTVLTTDKDPALLCAFKKLRNNGFYTHTTHCTIKHLNNLIEQDHRHASRTIKGIETIQAIYKKKRSLYQPNFVFSTSNELQQLLATA
ncbi:IS6 family transposase (plasmid) [Bacillus mycoides]|uniref:IS6 family transposase n=1 Tax=Bacillus mycoides TaxID=1405 RepID=UPI001C031B67|nr:IS6 family transposase [Bacillus mycoides]QWH75394.1 IS6 family transposase [Bacillus mycoides]